MRMKNLFVAGAAGGLIGLRRIALAADADEASLDVDHDEGHLYERNAAVEPHWRRAYMSLMW